MEDGGEAEEIRGGKKAKEASVNLELIISKPF